MSDKDGPRRTGNGKPTIDDVARVAGVSRTSVSRVLNNGPNVRETLRAKVTEAVEALGYEVNLQARSLAGGHGGQIALVHQSDLDAEPNSYYHAALELGALRACATHGYQLVTQTVSPEPTAARGQLVAMIRKDWMAGVLVTPPLADDPALAALAAEAGKPIVGISAGCGKGAAIPSVGIDDHEAGRELGRYLVDLGHRRFAYMHGPADHHSATRRYQGLLSALREAGIEAEVAGVQGDFTFHSGIEGAQAFLALSNRPTALVCANDDMAAGALLAIHRANLRIPQDVSITGFDDTPLSEIIWPPLTTVHQPIKELGQRAAELLIGLVGRDAEPSPEGAQQFAPHFLVPRESTGRPVA